MTNEKDLNGILNFAEDISSGSSYVTCVPLAKGTLWTVSGHADRSATLQKANHAEMDIEAERRRTLWS